MLYQVKMKWLEMLQILLMIDKRGDLCGIRVVSDCTISRLSQMAIKKFVLRVNWVQKAKETVNNLLLSIAPHVHRVRRGNTKENMQSCKFLL